MRVNWGAVVVYSVACVSVNLHNVERFRYLGRILSHDDTDIPAMRRNLKKARGTWGQESKILTRKEVSAPVSGILYQAVMTAVLLHKSKSWNLPVSGLQVIEGFVEVTRRLTGIRPQQQTVGPSIYPNSKEVLRAAQLWTIGDYVGQRHNNIAKTVEGRTLLEEYRGAERKQGSPSCQY